MFVGIIYFELLQPISGDSHKSSIESLKKRRFPQNCVLKPKERKMVLQLMDINPKDRHSLSEAIEITTEQMHAGKRYSNIVTYIRSIIRIII